MRRVTRGVLASALAFGTVAAGHVAVSPAAFAEGQGPQGDGSARLSLTAGLHGVVAPGASVTATVTVDNAGDESVPAGRVTVEINKTALADADALTAWLSAGEAAGTFTLLGTEEADEVLVSESSTTSVNAPAAAIDDLAPGVYPIRAQLAGDTASDDLGASSVLVVGADSSRQISVLVPVTATPADRGLLTAAELETLTAPDGALTAQLDGVAGTSAVLAVDPLIPAAIRALGSSAPVSAVSWLDRLESLSNERFALQPGDADAAVQARAGLGALLEPLPLTPYLTPTDFTGATATPTPSSSPTTSPTPSPTPSATQTPDTDEPELPSYEELTAIRNADSGILWPFGDVQTADLPAFDDYLGTSATTIVPSTSVTTTGSALVDVDGHRVLAVATLASDTLSDAAATGDDATRDQAIATGIAQLTFAGDEPSLLIGLDRDETRSAPALRETITSLSTIGQPTPLSVLRDSDPVGGTLVGDASTARVDTLNSLLDGEEQLTSFASILDDPLVLLSPERIKILRLMAAGAADDLAAGSAAHGTATKTTLNAVSVQQPSPIQLFTAAAPLPVWVRNDLPWPVNVTLHSRPSDARLDIEPHTPVEAQPASNTRVKVPVAARVGSGVLDVRFGLTSPTGVRIGDDQTATVTVRAEWEGIGLGILGGVIGLLLLLGIVRTVIRRRRGR